MLDKDIIVIGGGPGGYVAAIRAAQLGASVLIIEKDKVGGTCLNRGCIPTKTLYREAEILNTLKKIDEFGISIDGYRIDVEKVQSRKQEIITQLVSGIEQLLKANNVEVIRGAASFKDKNTVSVLLQDGSQRNIAGENIIIAAGSRPSLPPILGADLDGIYTSEDILNFKDIPKSLAVIGGGVVGMELACIFNAMGTKVTVLEFLPNILMQLDSDIVKRLTPALKKKGIDINTSTKITKIEKADAGFAVSCEGKKGEIRVEAEKVLIAAGRVPMTEGLNLEGIGVRFDKTGIKVDSNYETNIKGIYAIGDINGQIMLAHAASHQGIETAETIKKIEKQHNNSVVPSCVFVFPEIACVGITEDEAKQKGISYKTSKFMFGANGKALALGEGEGFIKVISTSDTSDSNEEDMIIGVHIMGPHASDLINEGTLAITSKLTVKDIRHAIHAHPTLSEAFLEAVMGLDGEAIHIVPARK
jgi:dihydrolipoamide dehydrogenase